jgi:hypothetical protein
MLPQDNYKRIRWRHNARNGSHYGLGQMRSTWYRDLDPYRQIDATLRYITKRYQTPCKAWTFHERKELVLMSSALRDNWFNNQMAQDTIEDIAT